jgi:serine/threonine-protein kinase
MARDVPVKPGDLLDGKYRVERVLGAGGMGVVVQARHVDLNTRVAIKFMLPDALNDQESVERFHREARAAVRLRSDHTARVLDVGRMKNGAPYMVMEFLIGQDLGQIVEASGPLPITSAVEYLLQACEAIAEAHAIGIVHRDIKPRNLFLTKRIDGRPLVKVLDFGLAKTIDHTQDRALTRTTAVMGSPQYMSPEQMRATRSVDGRTDIWSLGVCLYELVTGSVPFDAATVPELCALVLKDPPPPPIERRADLPSALSALILKCLEKDPSLRFPDVAAFAEALEEYGSVAARGAASRVRHVLTTTPRVADSEAPPPPGLDANAISVRFDTNAETRTAATFDSRPKKETRGGWIWVGAATAALTVVGVVGLAFVLGVVRARPARPVASVDHPPAAVSVVSSEPAPPPAPASAAPPPPVIASAPPATPAPHAAVTTRRPVRPAKPPPPATAAPPPSPPPPPPPPPKKDPGSDF